MTVLLAAAALYGVAGSLALRIPRTCWAPTSPRPPAVRKALGGVVTGLVDGLRHSGPARCRPRGWR